jgi:hypothetical protein
MARSRFDACFSEDDNKLSSKVVYHLKSGVCQCPLALWPQHVLDVVIPCCGNKDTFMMFLVRGLPQRIPVRLILVFVSNRLACPIRSGFDRAPELPVDNGAI